MFDLFLRFSLFGFMAVAVSACTVDASGLAPSVSWEVEPRYFCPGDPVEVSYDLSRMGKDPRNCNPANGGYGSLLSCSSTVDCPGGDAESTCLDGYCCRDELYEAGGLMCATDAGCYPAFDISVRADTVSLDPPIESESTRVRGRRTVTPPSTTVFEMEGGYARPPQVFADRITATMVTSMPETSHTMDFPFICSGSAPGWAINDLDEPRFASENVEIIAVRNTSGHIIQLSGGDPSRGPITLSPGEMTDAFNGAMAGTWAAGLSPLDRASLVTPRCEATNISDPWPDLQVELVLDCAVDEE